MLEIQSKFSGLHSCSPSHCPNARMLLYGTFHLPTVVFSLLYLIFSLKFCEAYGLCFHNYYPLFDLLPIGSWLVGVYFMDWFSICLFYSLFYSQFFGFILRAFLNFFFWLLYRFCFFPFVFISINLFLFCSLLFNKIPDFSTCILELRKKNLKNVFLLWNPLVCAHASVCVG